MTIRAIDTRYKGYLFRSRLEARWAVFFDALGIKWEYEVEGFDLGVVCYLPDFKLFEGISTSWLEVKPSEPDMNEREKARRLAEATRHLVCIVVGPPGCDDDKVINAESYYLSKCDPAPGSAINLEKVHLTYPMTFNELWPGRYYADASEWDRAVSAARSARFEHGQSGATLQEKPWRKA